MIRRIPASRAIVLAAGLVMAMTSAASAEEATTTTVAVEAPAPAEPFSPTIYVGPGFGLADQIDTEFGWSIHALMRPLEYLAIQIEYLNLGEASPGTGDHDFGYFGLAPMYPILPHTLDVYGQVGLVVGEAGEDVAAGGGLLYTLPIEFLEKTNVDLALQLDYKYLNIDDGDSGGDHLLTLGILLGLHK